MLAASLQSAIKSAVETTLAPLRVIDVGIVEAEDYEAKDVVFVTIGLPADGGPVPGNQMLRAMNAVSETLLRLGDEREPYFRTVREGEAEPADEDADALS